MRKWYPAIVALAVVIFTAAVYGRIPEHVPVHWGLDGDVDRYGSRAEGALLMPFLMLGTWALMKVLPTIDPRRENYTKFAGTYELFVNAVLTTLALMHVALVGAALGWPISIARVVPALVGTLFVILGNALPRARPNWWFGIRTPWTLTNERVWTRTHRVAGYLLAASGAVLVLVALVPGRWPIALAIGSVIVASLSSIVYSFIAWKQETGK